MSAARYNQAGAPIEQTDALQNTSDMTGLDGAPLASANAELKGVTTDAGLGLGLAPRAHSTKSNQAAIIKGIDSGDREPEIIRPTLKRYVILLLYGVCSMEKSFQWINLSAITNKVSHYYDVDNIAVNWTSVLFMITFIPLVLPTGWLIGRIGIRKAVLIGSVGITVGAIVKCFACEQDRFYVIILGQIVVSLSEQFIFCIPARVASVWFPDNQVSLATGFGIFGNQCGIALGFLIPQAILDGLESRYEIGLGLRQLFNWTAAISAFTLLLLLVLFDEAPKYAPGAARVRKIKEEQTERQMMRSFTDEMRLLGTLLADLITERNCFLLVLAYGINVGTGYAIQTLLNQMISSGPWQDPNQLIGTGGLVIIASGMVGALFWGHLCDFTRRYLLITQLLYVGAILSLFLFGYTLYVTSEILLYLSATLLGFFLIGYTVVGLDTVVEITYPAPELISTSLANLSPQIFGIAITFVSSHVTDTINSIYATAFLILVLIVGLSINLAIREHLNRQSAVRQYVTEKSLKLEATANGTPRKEEISYKSTVV